MKIDCVYEYLIQMALPFMEHFIKLDLFTRISIRQTPEFDERFTIFTVLLDIKQNNKKNNKKCMNDNEEEIEPAVDT